MKRQEFNYIYFIEKLTSSTWLLSVFPFFMSKAMQPKIIYYIDGSWLGVCIARIMSKWLKIKLEFFEFRMADIRDGQGNLISLRVLYQDLNNLQDDILRRPIFAESIEKKKIII